MSSLEDFQNFQRAFENERERLQDADIDDRDRVAIGRYLDRNLGDLAVSTLRQYGTAMRKAAERSPTPLVEMDEPAFWALRRHLLTATDLEDSTVHNHVVAVRQLCTFLEKDFVEDIELSEPDPPPIDPDDMLDQDDIAAMRSAATRNRDIAIIEFLADTGARLSLVGSLRVGDVDLETDRPSYRPNDEAIGLKGADITTYPIIDSKGALRAYLNHTHPRPESADVALLHQIDAPNNSYDPDDDGSLSPESFRRIIRRPARQAGIEKPVNPHNFRHSAISRMDREGYDRSEIEHRVHWHIDSDMWDRYLHLKAEQLNDDIWSKAGMGDPSASPSSEREQCPHCREPLPPYGEYCPTCANPVTREARETQERYEDDMIDALADGSLSPRETRIVRAALDLSRRDSDATPSHESPSND